MSKCRKELSQLEQRLRTKLQGGEYICAGGSEAYQRDLNNIQQQYEGKEDLGVKVSIYKCQIHLSMSQETTKGDVNVPAQQNSIT